MAHEETIYGLMESLVIADKHIIGDLMAHKELWTKGVSAVNNSYKALNLLADSGKLVKGNGYFRLPDCKSEYKEHSQLLTKAISEILKLNYQTKILREPTLKDVGLRPDAIVFLTNGDKGLCFILEVCNNETPEYLMQKIHTWEHWNEAKENLSTLFNDLIKQYDIVVASEEVPNGAFECNSYLETLRR
jgi:hypothetical protein